MNGFVRRREQKKENIRQAALKLFMEKGIHKVSIEEIAKLAVVSQVTIYNHFGSKEQLASIVAQQHMEEQWEQYEALIHSSIPFSEKFHLFVKKRANMFESFNMEFLESFIAGNPALAALTKRYEEKAMLLMIDFIEEGKASHYFDKNLSTDTIMFYLNLFSTQIVHQLQQFEEEETKRRVYKELLSVFFYGITGNRDKSMLEFY